MALGDLVTTVLGSVFGSWSSVLLLCVVLLATWMYYRNPGRHAPPGPINCPLIGSIAYFFGADLNGLYFLKLSEKYRSPIVSDRVMGQLRTALNDYDLIKEVFAKRTDVVDRTTTTTLLMDALENYERHTSGLNWGSGRHWRDQRRFTLRMMKDFGMGKISGEDNIHFEALETIEAFKKFNGQPFNAKHTIMMANANITNQFIFGKRFSYDDERAITILNSLNIFMTWLGEPLAFVFPTRLGRWLFKSSFEHLRDAYMTYANHVKAEIEEHKARFDGSVHDLIDAYLVDIKTINDKEVCNETELMNMIRDLFLSGSDSTANTLLWALLEMAIHQDIQEKVYKELSTVLVSGSVPTMSGKIDTPYTEAVMCENLRFHTLAEIGAPRANVSSDMEIRGYTIPKDTMIYANLYAVHHDPKYWKRPHEFYPENFLDENGKLTNLEKLIPFSIGRRSCVCEPLARAEIYIFFATWMKAFHIKLEADDTVPDITPTGYLVRMPKPFCLRMYPR